MRPLSLCLALMLLFAAAPAGADVGGDVLANLKRGLRNKAPEVRAKAILDVGRLSGHLDDRQKKKAAALLNRAFEKETETETRRLMVKAMARLRHESGWIPVVNAALGDRDPQIQAAARLAVFGGGSDLLEVMEAFISQEKSDAYRARLILLLGDRRRRDAVPLLIDQLRAKQAMVVAAAAEALEAITKEAFGYDPAKWKVWHTRWLEETLEGGETGPSISPTDVEAKEPEAYRPKSLHPNFYGLHITSKDVVFVVDISGSVGSSGVERAKRELVKAVQLLGSDVNIAALFFADKVHYWNQGRMVKATPENKEKLAFFLKGLEPGRSTDVFTAFNGGLKVVQKRVAEATAAKEAMPEPAALVVVSDGRHNAKDGVPIKFVEDKLAMLDLERTVVHAIVLGGKHSKIMRTLAREGSGHYIIVPSRD